MQHVKEYRYEAIAFLTGMSVLILEIVGGRLIAPYFGSSIYVWTSIIGVILGALAAGYGLGGRLADRVDAARSLAGLILMAAGLVLAMGLLQQPVLEWLAGLELDIRLSAFGAALLLFALPSTLIGMVSPHLAKIRLTNLQDSGKTIGRLEAAGAIGSIGGTFLCGYVLLGLFGSRSIVVGVAVTLVLTSFLAAPRGLWGMRSGVLLVAVVQLAVLFNSSTPGVLADVDSSYSRYQVQQLSYGGQLVNGLVTDRQGIQSAVNPAQPESLVFSYTRQFMNVLKAAEQPRSILVIGGGTFTFPAAVARQYPNVQVDAVEIDPALTGIAQQYFGLQRYPNLRIINQDGRAYINTADKRYDMVFLDAYTSLSPPFQLTSQQAIERATERLSPRGTLVSNLIGRSDAYSDRYLQAMYATLRSVVPATAVYPATPGVTAAGGIQNFVAISPKKQLSAALAAATGSKAIAYNPDSFVLTDDYAPIEQLIN